MQRNTGYFPTESLEPSGNRLFSRSALNEGDLFRGSLDEHSTLLRYGGVSFHAQSHGESFLSLVTNRFEGNGLYILDEPEAALSPQRLMSLMIAIDELVEENSQFVIATHSPILMTYPKAEILEMTDTGIHKVKYSETEHYKITKQFLDDPERMLRYLFRD